MEIFKDELAALINKYGIDADANTPDYLLAEIAVDAISSVVGLVKTRDEYKEKPEKPTEKLPKSQKYRPQPPSEGGFPEEKPSQHCQKKYKPDVTPADSEADADPAPDCP